MKLQYAVAHRVSGDDAGGRPPTTTRCLSRPIWTRLHHVQGLSHIGKSVLIPEVKEPTLFESNMMKIRFDRGLDLRFGAMVLLSDNTRRYFNAMAKKAVQQASINQQDVSELPVPLPPLAEQQAIAGLLDGVETTVAAANREREGFQSLKDSTADALLMGRVRVEV